MAHLVETMFSVREMPWHKLGHIIQDAPTSADALRIAELDWKVECRPVYVPDRMNPHKGDGTMMNAAKDFRAVTRVADNRVYTIVSDEYRPVQNHEAFGIADGLLGEGCVFETAGSLRNGAVVWMLARIPKTIRIGGLSSEETIPYLLVTNSHDGTSAMRVQPTPVRVVCANTLAIALGRKTTQRISIRHTGDPMKKLAEARRVLGISNTYFETYEKTAEQLLNAAFTPLEFIKLSRQLLPEPQPTATNAAVSPERFANWEKQLTALSRQFQARDLENVRNTKYSALQAVAAYADHFAAQSSPKDQTARAERDTLRAWNDTSGLKSQALALLTA
jgi:phage/plasmid-like protein (TIGR03299 family)